MLELVYGSHVVKHLCTSYYVLVFLLCIGLKYHWYTGMDEGLKCRSESYYRYRFGPVRYQIKLILFACRETSGRRRRRKRRKWQTPLPLVKLARCKHIFLLLSGSSSIANEQLPLSLMKLNVPQAMLSLSTPAFA